MKCQRAAQPVHSFHHDRLEHMRPHPMQDKPGCGWEVGWPFTYPPHQNTFNGKKDVGNNYFWIRNIMGTCISWRNPEVGFSLRPLWAGTEAFPLWCFCFCFSYIFSWCVTWGFSEELAEETQTSQTWNSWHQKPVVQRLSSSCVLPVGGTKEEPLRGRAPACSWL